MPVAAELPFDIPDIFEELAEACCTEVEPPPEVVDFAIGPDVPVAEQPDVASATTAKPSTIAETVAAILRDGCVPE